MIYFIVAFLIVLADQVVKYFVTLQFSGGGHLDLIPNILRITFVKNTGCAFSFLSDYTLYLAIASAVICVAIIVLIIVCRWSGFGKLSLGFILGGAIGNLIDRFVIGYVVDMIEPRFVRFAVFNVADIFVTVGAIMLVLFILFGNKSTEPMTSAERKERNFQKKYGPDVDESSIVLPTEEIKKAEEELDLSAIAPDVDAEDATRVFKVPDFTVSAPKQEDGEKTEFTLEDILKEYGSDF